MHCLLSDDGLRYIAEEIGDKYLFLGTFLLDDHDGSKMAELMEEISERRSLLDQLQSL